MAVEEAFKNVLSKIQNCGLNFKIEVSPFSANISIKKSFIRDKSGNIITPGDIHFVKLKQENDFLVQQLNFQESKFNSLKSKYENSLLHSEKSFETKEKLESKVQMLKLQLQEAVEEIDKLSKIQSNADSITTAKAEEDLEKLKYEAVDMKKNNEHLKQKLTRLNSELSETRVKTQNEIVKLRKAFKAEVKQWKKDLGEERKLKIRLEKKLENSAQKPRLTSTSSQTVAVLESSFQTTDAPKIQDEEITCTICAQPVSPYLPKFFHGIEVNPACKDCQYSSDSDACSTDLENPANTVKLDNENNFLNHEEIISEKIKRSIRTKLEVRHKNGEISEQEKKILEVEIWEEMKEEMREEANNYRKNLEFFDEPT